MSDAELSKQRPRQTLSVPLPYAVGAVLLAVALVLAVSALGTRPAERPTVMVVEAGWPVADQVAERRQEAARLGADTLVIVVHLEPAGRAAVAVPVHKDDTLDGLAKRWGIDPRTLAADNPRRFDKGKLVNPAAPISVRLTNPYQVPEGQQLFRSWAVGGPAGETGPAAVSVFTTAGAQPIVDALSSTVVVLDSTGQVWAGPPDPAPTGAAWRWVLVVFLLILAALCLVVGRFPAVGQVDAALARLTRMWPDRSVRGRESSTGGPSPAAHPNPGGPPGPVRTPPREDTTPPTTMPPAGPPMPAAGAVPRSDMRSSAGKPPAVASQGKPPVVASQPGNLRTHAGYDEPEQPRRPAPAPANAPAPVAAPATGTAAGFDFTPWIDRQRGPESAAQCPRCFSFGLFRRESEYRCDRCGEAGRVASGVWPGVVLGGAGTYGGSKPSH
ncbi:hypothetical protein [Micromonospora sp. NPDC004704]